jgi:HrpA-like RNA helicase
MVRFDDCSSPATKIKYMTDGCLVRECLSDPLLKAYSIIMLDEAHERSIHTDVLFGLMKQVRFVWAYNIRCQAALPQCLRERDDVKVIVTSATLDFEKISSYYGNCPVMFVPGRVFSVDIYHSKTHQVMTATGPATDSYVEVCVGCSALRLRGLYADDPSICIYRFKACVETAMKIHSDQAPGHILVFLTGQDEIERACHKLVNMKRQVLRVSFVLTI